LFLNRCRYKVPSISLASDLLFIISQNAGIKSIPYLNLIMLSLKNVSFFKIQFQILYFATSKTSSLLIRLYALSKNLNLALD